MIFTSPMVAAGSGSVGGLTLSRNRGGMYFRARAVPVNPSTSFQMLNRSRFSNLAVRWLATLTAAQRSGWETFAANVPVVNALGQQIFLTGQQWYIKANQIRGAMSATTIDAAPTTFNMAVLSNLIITATAPDQLSVAYTNTDTWAGAVGGHLAIYASRPVDPTINYTRQPFRFAGRVNGAATPPTSPAVITAPFPFATGNKVFFRGIATNADGRPSPNFFAFDVV